MSDENMDMMDDLEGFDDELDTIVMTDENGNETTFFVIDEVEMNDTHYLLLLEESMADDDQADAVLFKQVAADGDDFIYEPLNDAEFEAVAKVLSERLDDYEITF